MFIHVFHVFPRFSKCLSTFFHGFPRVSTGFQMFTHVFPRFSMFSHVFPRVSTFFHVFPRFPNVFPRFPTGFHVFPSKNLSAASAAGGEDQPRGWRGRVGSNRDTPSAYDTHTLSPLGLTFDNQFNDADLLKFQRDHPSVEGARLALGSERH